MLHSNGILQTERGTIVLNRFAGKELTELTNDIIENMLSDLSIITGLDKEEIMQDYVRRNEWNVFDEIIKKQGKSSLNNIKSLVLKEYEYQEYLKSN